MTQTRRERLYVIFLLLLMALRLFFWASPDHQIKMTPAFVWPMVVAAAVLLIADRRLRGSRPAQAAMLLAGWFAATTLINGDHYLEYNLIFLCGVVATFGLFFPMALTAERKEKAVTALAAGYGLIMTFVALLCLYFCATGAELRSPFSGVPCAAGRSTSTTCCG